MGERKAVVGTEGNGLSINGISEGSAVLLQSIAISSEEFAEFHGRIIHLSSSAAFSLEGPTPRTARLKIYGWLAWEGREGENTNGKIKLVLDQFNSSP